MICEKYGLDLRIFDDLLDEKLEIAKVMFQNGIYLFVAYIQINDFSPLSNLVKLQVLGLESSQINVIPPSLKDLTALTVLRIGYNKITDISPLKGFTALTLLDLNYNQISDISPLSNLTELVYLELLNNPITTLGPLSTLNKGGGLPSGSKLYINKFMPSGMNFSILKGLEDNGVIVKNSY